MYNFFSKNKKLIILGFGFFCFGLISSKGLAMKSESSPGIQQNFTIEQRIFADKDLYEKLIKSLFKKIVKNEKGYEDLSELKRQIEEEFKHCTFVIKKNVIDSCTIGDTTFNRDNLIHMFSENMISETGNDMNKIKIYLSKLLYESFYSVDVKYISDKCFNICEKLCIRYNLPDGDYINFYKITKTKEVRGK